jgi:hypothetical protein
MEDSACAAEIPYDGPVTGGTGPAPTPALATPGPAERVGDRVKVSVVAPGSAVDSVAGSEAVNTRSRERAGGGAAMCIALGTDIRRRDEVVDGGEDGADGTKNGASRSHTNGLGGGGWRVRRTVGGARAAVVAPRPPLRLGGRGGSEAFGAGGWRLSTATSIVGQSLPH